MAESSWPFHDGADGTPVLEDQWSIMARHWAATGVVGAPADTSLQVYANSSGREVHVQPGLACIRGHWYSLDTETALDVGANTSGNPRIDTVVVKLDPSSDEAALDVKEGTPSSTPIPADLDTTDLGAYEMKLAYVVVADGASTLAAGTVMDERTFSSVPYTTALSSLRPASPVVGHRIYEADTGYDKVWNGSAWVVPSIPKGTVNGAPVARQQIQAGSVSVPGPALGGASVTFATAFGSAPNVVVTPQAAVCVYVSNVTTTGFDIDTDYDAGSVTCQWVAVGD